MSTYTINYTKLSLLDQNVDTQYQQKDQTNATVDEDEEETRLTSEQLQQLASSDQVRSFLEYPQIRDLVTQIDKAPQPDKLLDAVRKEDSVFEDFVLALLKSTNSNNPTTP
ncbi:hypothetical protein [Absidia glauca]|uniref:Uncharacterized protein n=1 Tax=Absidia glauca TaxID=4829 RepID=A0A168PFX5_ABSGL|nr:hypothetical protein [Absidia glauca]